MPGSKYSEKQMKIARVAEPRDAITGADFEAMNNSKMGGGMIKYSEGGDIRKEMLTQMLEDARESGDDDKIIEIEAELFQMGDGEGMMMGGMVKKPKGYRRAGDVSKKQQKHQNGKKTAVKNGRSNVCYGPLDKT